MASHAHSHTHHGIPPWLPLTPQQPIRRQRSYTATLIALATALILLATLVLWVSL